MLLLGTNPEIIVPCVAKNMDKGVCKPVKFNATFTRLDRTQTKELRKNLSEAMEEVRTLGREYAAIEDAGDEERKIEIKERINELDNQSEDVVREHLKDWDLKGVNGKVEFNEENVAEAFRWTAYFDALYEGLFQATGKQREQQKQKN